MAGGNGARLTRRATRTGERARGLRSTQAVDGCKQPAKYIQQLISRPVSRLNVAHGSYVGGFARRLWAGFSRSRRQNPIWRWGLRGCISTFRPHFRIRDDERFFLP